MTYFYDVIIFGFLLLDGALILYLINKHFPRLQAWAHDLITLITIVAWIVIFYGSFVEPQRIVVVEQEVTIGDGGRHAHIMLVSDIHAGRYKNDGYVQRVIDTINAAHPDIVVLLGDFVMDHESEAAALYPFEQISAVYPTYAVLGNHDHELGNPFDIVDRGQAGRITQTLELYGITVLRNEGVLLDDGLWLAGTEELWTNRYDIRQAVNDRPESVATILATHNPDIVQKIAPEHDIDLVVAGHTHGGQIRLPIIGSVPRIPDDLGRAYDRGLFTYAGTTIFITSGVGESGPRARLFNPPEVVSLGVTY